MTDTPIKKDDIEQDILEDKSAYGEFISTFHHWTGLEGNHKRASYLEQVTNKQRNVKDKPGIKMKDE